MGSGAYLQDLSVDLGDYADGNAQNISGTGNTMSYSNDVFTIHQETITDVAYHPWCQRLGNYVEGELYMCVAIVNVTQGSMYFTQFNMEISSPLWLTVSAGETTTFIAFGNMRASGNIELAMDGTKDSICDATINFTARKVTAYEIQNYTEAARLANQTYGLQALSVIQDASGRPLAMADANTIVCDSSGKNLNGSWKPDLARYSIESTVGGDLQDFGIDIVMNGGFDTDSDWTKESNWAIDSGEASTNNSGGTIYQRIGEVGKTYLITFEITSYTSGYARARAGNDYGDTFDIVGIHTSIVTCTSLDLFGVTAENPSVLSIDNVSVKELTTKTNRVESRVLSHDDAVMGSDSKQSATSVPSGVVES